jgi:hypothetical protein
MWMIPNDSKIPSVFYCGSESYLLRCHNAMMTSPTFFVLKVDDDVFVLSQSLQRRLISTLLQSDFRRM